MQEFLSSKLPFPKRSGKVRDVYDLGDRLLIVATDRISAYDVVMPNGIPARHYDCAGTVPRLCLRSARSHPAKPPAKS